MIVRYLYSESCLMCDDFKDVGIPKDMYRLLGPIRDIHWVPGPVAETDTSRLTRDGNGRVTRKGTIVRGQVYHDIIRDRGGESEDVGTPMIQLVNGQRQVQEFYPQFAIAETPSRIGRLLNSEPWECKRRITQRLFHHYLAFGLNLHPKDQVAVRKALQPEKQRRQYQLTEWRDVFRQASEL